jgi:hypothetical protein
MLSGVEFAPHADSVDLAVGSTAQRQAHFFAGQISQIAVNFAGVPTRVCAEQDALGPLFNVARCASGQIQNHCSHKGQPACNARGRMARKVWAAGD